MRTISRILIANRGEVALRIIRTAKDMGIATVAVYADQDIAAPFTHFATEAWGLSGDTAQNTYLNAEKILQIAVECGADAIHPGYGFLSEEADFADAVEDEGIAWIGPSGAVIRALGDKIKARRVAESCGVSPVPGVSAPISSREEVERFIGKYGYPVVLKRADGGGGRGISIMHNESDLSRFFERFGSADEASSSQLGMYFVERYVEVARHIETQCARDRLGTFRVVSTRDCSIQRRNQKLIEEAPAPFLSEETNAQLVESSKRLFDEVGYVGVGTCEFLLEPDGSLWFLEVNPRLQVEHPVSEEVAGIDLVREQVRIAEGLPLTPPASPRGHSIEFRITSEDPANDLMPAGGHANKIWWPSGPGVRLEIGLAEGDEVQTAFDSMIAKIIVSGTDRHEALTRARRALGEFSIEGVPTPVEMYRDIISEPDFIGGDGFNVSTGWLERVFLPANEYSTEDVADESSLALERRPRTTYVIELDGRRMTLTVPSALLASTAISRPVQPLRGTRAEARTMGVPLAGTSTTGGILTSPMQAIVVKIAVHAGDKVEKGQLMVVLEAMKMEKYIQAPFAGTVTEVLTSLGSSVATGDALLKLNEDEA